MAWNAVLCALLAALLIGCRGAESDRAGVPDSRDFTKMPGSTHAQRDAEILNILVKRGADLTKPRHSLFYLYFPSKEQADAAKSEIKEHDIAREKKFKVEVRQDSEDTD